MIDINDAASDEAEVDIGSGAAPVDMQIQVNVHVSKPVRGCSDVTLTDAGNGNQVLHQHHFKAGDADERRAFLDAAIQKCPALEDQDFRDEIDRQISQQRLEWDMGKSRSGEKGEDDSPKFWRHGNSIVWNNDGKATVLSNFYPEILADVVVTDGVDEQRFYEVRIETDNRPSQTRLIPAGEFDAIEWISGVGSWYALSGDVPRCSKLVAEAVKALSREHGEKTQYRHTGWIQHDGQARFLSASGALGKDGLDESLKTMVRDASDHLGYYRLVNPPSGTELIQAVQATLNLLQLSADRSKIWPLVGSLYATPLMDVNYTVFSIGRTGAYKSSTQRLVLGHTGTDWCERPLSSFKNATAFGLQLQQFRAKDMLLVFDDCQRPSTKAGTDRINSLAQSVFQNQADRSGRAKGNADGTQHSAKPSRCSLISNGEDTVPGLSTAARLLVISYQKGDIDQAVLTRCQEMAGAGLFVKAYSGYISWLAADLGKFRDQAAAKELEYRKQFTVDGQHSRTAENLAQAMVGIFMYLNWCLAAGAMTDAEYDLYYSDASACLVALGVQQKAEQDEQDPVNAFLEGIIEALASGRCHVTRPDGTMPCDPVGLGWVQTENGQYSRWDPKGPRVGYLDSQGNLCLMLSTALSVLQQNAAVGNLLTIGHIELGRQMAKAGKVVTDGKGNPTRPVNVGGASKRLTCIQAEVFQSLRQHVQWP